jgi:hypothetical protein
MPDVGVFRSSIPDEVIPAPDNGVGRIDFVSSRPFLFLTSESAVPGPRPRPFTYTLAADVLNSF